MRAAAAQAIEATAGQAGFTRERAQQLADELVHAAGRFRETLEELRPRAADELGALRERVAALEARVAQARGRPAPHRAGARTPAKRPPAVLDLSAGRSRGRAARPHHRRGEPVRRAARPPAGRRRRASSASSGVDTRPVDPDARRAHRRRRGRPARAELPRRWSAPRRSTPWSTTTSSSSPSRGARARALHDINVIGTLQLLTVCDGLPTLRAVVVRGSAAIYGSEPGAPAFFTEDDADRFPLRTRFQRDIGELEQLVGAFARRHPAVACTVLRLQPVVGRGLDTPVNRLLRAPVVPTVLGYDPRVQLLDADDAVGALRRAVLHPVRGPVNIAAEGVVSLSRALRHARPPGAADRRAALGPGRRHGAARARPAGAARRGRALPALRPRRRHRRGCAASWASARDARRRSRRSRRGHRATAPAPAMTRGRLGLRPRLRPRAGAAARRPLHALVARDADGVEHVPADRPGAVRGQPGRRPAVGRGDVATALRRHDGAPRRPAALPGARPAPSSCRGRRRRCAASAACPRRPATPRACSPRATW